MARKRSYHKDEEEEEESKRRRKGNPNINEDSTDEVEVITSACDDNGGISERETFTGKHRVDHKSFLEIKSKLNGGHIFGYTLYPAFKEALLRLLTKIEEVLSDENNKVRVIMIHGVPSIGKSSLARCLAYLLAMYEGTKETVHRIAFQHNLKLDSDGMTDKVVRALSDKYLIVDQLNTNSLDLSKMIHGLERRLSFNKISMPIIMFTSGHYAPGEGWLAMQKSGWLCYKLIQMRSDAALVGELRTTLCVPEHVTISSDDILNVTNIYKRITDCMNYLRDRNSKAKEDDLRRFIYDNVDIDFLKKESIMHVIWITWEAILSKGLPRREDFTDDFCKMEPRLVEYIGYIISGIKDGRDRGINALLNQMDITGEKFYDNNNYSEFNPDAYTYIFLKKQSLYKLLKNTLADFQNKSAQEKVNVFVNGFNLLQDEGSQANSGRGILLEYIIKYFSIAEKERWKCQFAGMIANCSDHTVIFRKVDHYQEVATVNELCSLPLNTDTCRNKEAHVFCFMNAPGRKAFRGYDFVYIKTRCLEDKIEVKEMHLFQVTVSLRSKDEPKQQIMVDVLNEIKQELQKQKLIKRADADDVVKPFFVVPAADDEEVQLPCKSLRGTISADVLELQVGMLMR